MAIFIKCTHRKNFVIKIHRGKSFSCGMHLHIIHVNENSTPVFFFPINPFLSLIFALRYHSAGRSGLSLLFYSLLGGSHSERKKEIKRKTGSFSNWLIIKYVEYIVKRIFHRFFFLLCIFMLTLHIIIESNYRLNVCILQFLSSMEKRKRKKNE